MTIRLTINDFNEHEIEEMHYDTTDIYRVLAEHIKHKVYHDDFEIEVLDDKSITLIFD